SGRMDGEEVRQQGSQRVRETGRLTPDGLGGSGSFADFLLICGNSPVYYPQEVILVFGKAATTLGRRQKCISGLAEFTTRVLRKTGFVIGPEWLLQHPYGIVLVGTTHNGRGGVVPRIALAPFQKEGDP